MKIWIRYKDDTKEVTAITSLDTLNPDRSKLAREGQTTVIIEDTGSRLEPYFADTSDALLYDEENQTLVIDKSKLSDEEIEKYTKRAEMIAFQDGLEAGGLTRFSPTKMPFRDQTETLIHALRDRLEAVTPAELLETVQISPSTAHLRYDRQGTHTRIVDLKAKVEKVKAFLDTGIVSDISYDWSIIGPVRGAGTAMLNDIEQQIESLETR